MQVEQRKVLIQKDPSIEDVLYMLLCANPKVTFGEIEAKWCARFGVAVGTVKAHQTRVRERCERDVFHGYPPSGARRRSRSLERCGSSHGFKARHSFSFYAKSVNVFANRRGRKRSKKWIENY